MSAIDFAIVVSKFISQDIGSKAIFSRPNGINIREAIPNGIIPKLFKGMHSKLAITLYQED